MRWIAGLVVLCGLGSPGITAAGAEDAPGPLVPGTYELTLRLEGRRDGGERIPDAQPIEVIGTVTLRATSAGDRSPRTGEQAKDGRQVPPLYGWTDAKLAPVMPLDRDAASPDSRDPVYPGLLAIRVPYGPGGPFTGGEEVTAILVNTLGNDRSGRAALDGGGFAMFLLRWDGRCHEGAWSRWGLQAVGSGTFRLCAR